LDKVFSHQSGEDLLNRVDFDRKEQLRGQIKGQIKEIKGTDQRRNVRRDQRSQIRAATKKPAIRGPTKIKNQQGSEERTL
jgi:hypothetical protein